MNLKTTIALAILVGAGVSGWIWLDNHDQPAETTTTNTQDFLHTKLTAEKLTRVEVLRRPKSVRHPRFDAGIVGLFATPLGQGPLLATSRLFPYVPITVFELEKTGNDWTLPGNWPTRKQETEDFLQVLTTLHTRYAPIFQKGPVILPPFALSEDPLVVKVTVGDETHTLRFAEEQNYTNPFTRATFMRLDEEGDFLQLGPGVYAALDRKLDHFQQRRLFPVESVAKDDDALEKIDQLAATAIEVQAKDTKFIIVKKDKDWILQNAYKKKDKEWELICSQDRIDPAKRDAILRFPDLWADEFVNGKSLDECGLKDPETILTLTRPNGAKVKLLIGNISDTKTRFEMKQGPPGTPPQPQMIKEEHRFAKLAGNAQIFKIKADKLGDLLVELDTLRDPQLARFKTDDVKRIQIRHDGQEIVLVKVKESDKEKAKEKWRFEKPNQGDADPKTVEEVLQKLAGLQARDKEIDDKIDAKTAGLDKPHGEIKLTLEEADKKTDDKDAKKKTRVIDFHLGAKEGDKLYVSVDSWPRVNKVSEDLWKQATRSDLAYRPRELWRIDRDDITRITIQANSPPWDKDAAPYYLDHTEKGWKLGGPLEAEVSAKDVDALIDELANLKADRFEAANVKDLDRFGIDNKNGKLSFKITVAAKKAKTHVLEIGNQVMLNEGGRYARIDGSDTVFVLNQKFIANLRTDPSDFLDKALWKLDADDIKRIRFTGFALEPKKGLWQIVDAPVPPFNVDDLAFKKTIGPLLQLCADKFAAFGGKIDLAKFGLDKPVNTVTVTVARDKDKATDHVVELGKEAPGGGRFARIDKKDSVVQLNSDTAEDLQRSYLDFLDARVLKFDGESVTTLERKMKDADIELTRREDNWLITKPGTRDADLLTINDVLRKSSQLQAKRIAAFPAKDLQPFGLDKPAAVVTLLLESPDGRTSKHVIKVGNLAKDVAKKDTDERYALIDDRPMVVVLSADLSRHLVAPVLYYADRNLASFSTIDRAELTRGNRKAVFNRTDKGWKMTQPIETAAEDGVIDELIRSTQRLRADEIVADKGADLKKFGLDQPFLQWRLNTGDTEQLNLIVGNIENDQSGARRYAKLGDKNQVFLLSSKLTAKVQAEPRDRKPWAPFAGGAVSKLTVVSKDKSFTLDRKGAKWELAGDAKAKVNDNAVMNMVNVLEALRAVHYVADAKADLKSYGLDNPQWKIEIDPAKDKRVLWLGDYEGKTKRLFATVPGSGAVFVIDEIDALILARPRSAYLEAEKKK